MQVRAPKRRRKASTVSGGASGKTLAAAPPGIPLPEDGGASTSRDAVPEAKEAAELAALKEQVAKMGIALAEKAARPDVKKAAALAEQAVNKDAEKAAALADLAVYKDAGKAAALADLAAQKDAEKAAALANRPRIWTPRRHRRSCPRTHLSPRTSQRKPS
jgi:hypothetical protein